MPAYRIAVLADIHGNLQALEAVLADLAAAQPLDGIVVAGDMISGPDQQEVLRRLVGLQAVMIQGNNERAAARMAAGKAPAYYDTARQFSIRRWVLEHLDPEQRALIAGLPEQTVIRLPGADPIRVAHGSLRDINELIFPDHFLESLNGFLSIYPDYSADEIDQNLDLMTEPVLVLGHAHLPWHERRDGRLMMNPGAVSTPLDGWDGAQYALLHWDGVCWSPEFRAVRYDEEAFRRANETSGFLSNGILARIFMEEAVTGKPISIDFFCFVQRLAEEAGCGDLPYYPDEIWDRAEREFKL